MGISLTPPRELLFQRYALKSYSRDIVLIAMYMIKRLFSHVFDNKSYKDLQ